MLLQQLEFGVEVFTDMMMKTKMSVCNVKAYS